MCWGKFVLREVINPEYDSFPEKAKDLVTYGDKVLNKLPQTLNDLPKAFLADLPKQLVDKVFNSVIRLQEGYKEALVWEMKYESFLPFTILNPIVSGEYQAGCFIDPVGRFNDLVWVKCFVADVNQAVHCRFKLACLYCLEEAITDMWNSMKMNGKLPCRGKLTRIKSKHGYLIGFWAYRLENKIDKFVIENNNYEDSIYVFCLREAISDGHEHAARYFFSRCTDTEIQEYQENLEFLDLFGAADKRDTTHVYFLYSLLSPKQKNDFIHEAVGLYRNRICPWSCLLESRFYEPVLNDILNFTYSLPSAFYARILKSLAYKTKESRNPNHVMVFKRLWNHVQQEQREEVFVWGFHIIFLIKIKAIDLLEFIIQPLSDFERERVILNNWGGAGLTAIDEFSNMGDYDTLHRYLMFFLVHHDPITRCQKLRVDASNFLHSIKEMIRKWPKDGITESDICEVNKVMESLQESLDVLYQLLGHVEKCNFF